MEKANIRGRKLGNTHLSAAAFISTNTCFGEALGTGTLWCIVTSFSCVGSKIAADINSFPVIALPAVVSKGPML